MPSVVQVSVHSIASPTKASEPGLGIQQQHSLASLMLGRAEVSLVPCLS